MELNTLEKKVNLNEAAFEIKKIINSFYGSQTKEFVPGKSVVQYAGNVYGEEEINAGINVLLRGWLGLAENGALFETKMSSMIGQKSGVLTNSGSSANLLAIAAAKSRNFRKSLVDGDEVITPAAGFPTTINPIIQNGLVPVFVDVNLGDYNLNTEELEIALSPRTKAIMFAHTLGNPGNMTKITEFCLEHDLILIEDCCDALGGSYDGEPIGSFGDFSTLSFYPSHHITMGEGGFVAAKHKADGRILRSLRDWGRDCWCAGSSSLLENGSCNNRFGKWLDGVDEVVDHKYVYGEIGYNLKPIELQAAIGLEQIKRLEGFVSKRRLNFNKYFQFFKQYEDYFILPSWDDRANPSWFAFPLTVKDSAPFKRADIVKHLENHKIQTRNLFAGNILRQPGYKDIKCRVVGDLKNSDMIITNTFFIGVYPGLTQEMLDYVCETADDFLSAYSGVSYLESNLRAA